VRVSDSISVSIVIPTYNRLSRLCRTVAKVRSNVSVSHEVVVVDGGSDDGTREFLAGDGNLHVILEREREGAVRAFNKGFKAAKGQYVMWLNDDAYPLPGSVESALGMLNRCGSIGMAAFYHDWERTRNVLDSVYHKGRRYSMFHVRGYPYANFGLIRKSLLKRIGYADERYFFFGFDPDLSLKVQVQAGLHVVGCRGALVRHEEFHDERKLADLPAGDDDNQKLFEKWGLPEPGCYSDPVPSYRAMLHELGLHEDCAAQTSRQSA
jgi:GT2 family glycosyltransferase